MSADRRTPAPAPAPRPYHGMTWPVRLVVYFLCGVVLMGFVLLLIRRSWHDSWWVLWIPPATGVVGVFFPQAVDWLFSRIADLLRLGR